MTSRPSLRLPITAACAFVLLAVLAVGGWPPLSAADRSISERFRELGNATPTLIAWVRPATDVAATIPFLTAGVLLTLFLTVRREHRRAILTALTTATVPTLWSLMHLWLLHPRPENAFVTVASNGFPSGHTANATAASLLAFYLLTPRSPNPRSPRPLPPATRSPIPPWSDPRSPNPLPPASRSSDPRRSRRANVILLSAATLFALLIGLSRLTLLAHWPTEVLGGWLLGLAIVPLAAHFLAPIHSAPAPTAPASEAGLGPDRAAPAGAAAPGSKPNAPAGAAPPGPKPEAPAGAAAPGPDPAARLAGGAAAAPSPGPTAAGARIATPDPMSGPDLTPPTSESAG